MNAGFPRLALLQVLVLVSIFSFSYSNAQEVSSGDTDLLARQQIKTQQIENELRDLRGSMSDDMQDIRTRLSDIVARMDDQTIEDKKAIQKSISSLASLEDTISLLEQRMRRTIEMSSDLDFRIIRLENKLQTLLSLSTENSSSSNANLQDMSKPALDDPKQQSDNISNLVSSDGSTWLIDQQKLDENLSRAASDLVPVSDDVDALLVSQDTTSDIASQIETDDGNDNNTAFLSSEVSFSRQDMAQADGTSAGQYNLPAGTIEEQYNFAVKLALAKKLDEAANAFEAINATYPDEPRAADSLFFLGRVQYMQKQFELAAYSFSEFNINYPNDSRLVDSTLFLAKSVGEFADPEQACPIFKSLPELLEEKPQSFLNEMQLLFDKKQCQKVG
jgi:TolA-binding protein